MRVLIAVVVGVILALAIFLIVRSNIQGSVPGVSPERNELAKHGYSFLKALAQKDIAKIYRMFNIAFQKEISQEKLEKAINHWFSNDKYKTAKVGTVNISGLSGQITTWISFRKSSEPKFVYQYWINTNSGWRLMWLSGILNHRDFIYGDSDTTAQKEIMQLMIEQAAAGLVEEIFPGLEIDEVIIVLKQLKRKYAKIILPENRVFWLTEDEIEKRYARFGIDTYFEFGMIRVLDGVAIGALDIVPILSAEPPPKITRRRSIEMFFKKINNEWVFVDYGSKW